MSGTPRARFLAAKVERLICGAETPEIRTEIQAACYDALWCHAMGTQQLDCEIAAELAFALRDVVAGHTNPLFMPLRGRGAPGLKQVAKSCIRDAVRFVGASDEGVFADRAAWLKGVPEALVLEALL